MEAEFISLAVIAIVAATVLVVWWTGSEVGNIGALAASIALTTTAIGMLMPILAERGDHYRLLGMSRRIKERYMTEDELEKWGDEPWWRGGDNKELSLKDSFARSRMEWK